MDTDLRNATVSDRLDLDYEDLRTEITDALKATDSIIEITSDADMLAARELVAPLKALQGKCAAAHKVEKQMYLDGGRAVDAFFKAQRVHLDAVVALITEEASAWQAKKLAAARAEAAFLDEAPPKPAAMARVTDNGAVAVSASTRWDFEVVDIDAVPRELLMLNDVAVKARISGLKATVDIMKAADAIPGLLIFEKIGTRWK